MIAELHGFAQATTKTLERLSEPKVHNVTLMLLPFKSRRFESQKGQSGHPCSSASWVSWTGTKTRTWTCWRRISPKYLVKRPRRLYKYLVSFLKGRPLRIVR